MKTKKVNTLALNKQTVSSLTASDLRDVRGGSEFVIVESKDCVFIPIDYTIPNPSTVFAPDPEPLKTEVVSLQVG